MAFLSSQGSAIEMAATRSLATTYNLSSSKMNQMSVGQQMSSVVGALKESGTGLKAAAEARESLAQQLGGNVQNTPQALSNKSGSDSLGIKSMATSAVAGAALAIVAGPAAAAAYGVVDTLVSAAKMMSGQGHAGIGHAAIDGGKSEFSSPISRNGKGKSKDFETYTDSMGESWTMGGHSLSALKTSQPAANNAQFNPQQSLKSQQTLDRLGEEEIRAQLSVASKAEQGLMQQAGAARRFAENMFGVVGSDGKPDLKPLNPDGPSANDPSWKMAVNAPMMGMPRL